MSIGKTNIIPDILNRLRFTPAIQSSELGHIRFYIRGGANVIALRWKDPTLTFYVPRPCAWTDNRIVSELERQGDSVKELLSEQDKWYLYDLEQRAILTAGSFMDFAPISNIGRSLFIDTREGDSINAYYLDDVTEYGILQAAGFIFAKTKLVKPATGREWLLSAKGLLSYLIAKEYGLSGSFRGQEGPWSGVSYKFDNDESIPQLMSMISSGKISVQTALSMASGTPIMSPEEIPASWSLEDDDDSGDDVVYLTDLIEKGLSKILEENPYAAAIEVVVDTMLDAFRSVTIEVSRGLVWIELHRNCQLSLEELKAHFQTEHIVLIPPEPPLGDGDDEIDDDRFES